MPRASRPATVLPRLHPWERDQLERARQWDELLHRTPFGRSLPDRAGFLYPVDAPPAGARPVARGTLFALATLPEGGGPVHLVRASPRVRELADGRPVLLVQPKKVVLPSATPGLGETVLEAAGRVRPATWEDLVGGPTPGTAPADALRELREAWGISEPVLEALLLALVGVEPWHGRSASFGLLLEAPDWPLARQRSLLDAVQELAPAWIRGSRRGRGDRRAGTELASGATFTVRRAAATAPFSVRVRPWGRSSPDDRGTASPGSTLWHGPALASELPSILASLNLFVVAYGRELPARVPATWPEPSETVRRTVWNLHWPWPAPPDAPDWYAWWRRAGTRLAESASAVSGALDGPTADRLRASLRSSEFRDRAAQTATGRARLRGAGEVEESDLDWVVDRWTRTFEALADLAPQGRGPLGRGEDRSAVARTRRLRAGVEEVLRASAGGLTVAEAAERLGVGAGGAGEREVEELLERARIRGDLYQDRTGRYRPVDG